MIKKRFIVDDAGTLIDIVTRDTYDYVSDVVVLLNEQYEENQKLREALKNSYLEEICENCKHGDYWIDEYYGEGNFECRKKHFGNDHWKCDGLKECDDFELNIKFEKVTILTEYGDDDEEI